MSESVHIVCPECQATNRVALDRLGKEEARQPGAMGANDIVRWTEAQL